MFKMLKCIKRKTKDISFANLFCRKIVVRLLVFLLISFFGISSVQMAMEKQAMQDIDIQMSNLSLSLAQTIDMEMSSDRFKTTSNIILSKAQNEINGAAVVNNVTLSLYNLNEKTVMARSTLVPVIESQEVLDWWHLQAGKIDGLPKISLNDEMADFCTQNKDETIYIQEIYYLNSVLFPSSVSIKGADGMTAKECIIHVPSTARKYVCSENVELKIVGNEIDDTIYDRANEIEFQITQQDANDTLAESIFYPNLTEELGVKIIAKTFQINDYLYQVDCLYQINFWNAFLMSVVVFEIIGILLCVAAAFINTKETMYIYH